jgi:futalosine hydrolase
MILVVAATQSELHGAESLTQAGDATSLVCGVGPVEAAIHTSEFLATYPETRVVLHVGLAGARRKSGIQIGDLVVGTAALYCDTRSSLVETIAHPSSQMLDLVRGTIPNAHLVPIGTSGDVGGSSEITVEAMEGFSVLRAAHLAGVHALEVRVVSNEIEEQDRAKWQFARCLSILEGLIPKLVTSLSAMESDGGGPRDS